MKFVSSNDSATIFGPTLRKMKAFPLPHGASNAMCGKRDAAACSEDFPSAILASSFTIVT
jgi:hypothetical protein